LNQEFELNLFPPWWKKASLPGIKEGPCDPKELKDSALENQLGNNLECPGGKRPPLNHFGPPDPFPRME